MKYLLVLLFPLILIGCGKPCKKEVQSFSSASTIYVYEGLPHQTFGAELLEQELKRDDVIHLHDFPFYNPKVALAKEHQRTLQELFTTKNILPFSGEKNCGGFHPDYVLEWDFENQAAHILICFGCNEIKIVHNNKSSRHDLTPRTLEQLEEVLIHYMKKRPMNPPIHQ